MSTRLTTAERYQVAGMLRFAQTYYAQEAAAIIVCPRNGEKLSTVESKMVMEQTANAKAAGMLADKLTGADV